ncbi:hypothetical protein VE01_02772 [Pseudogymnoascus verrucosus]|uniref:Uncharacterized protein n=1 Tax=Pseudogymnoascus verrucosus TaxID=342668 RepID=A0A1B8GUP9_9PEZI|nr:uncharacterized protein VE01_02772 [Pseudogymnoascus verrucosus]OBT99553.1 hypothetical protein VE01_02772 [Pseudogymnoascus verrucosus]
MANDFDADFSIDLVLPGLFVNQLGECNELFRLNVGGHDDDGNDGLYGNQTLMSVDEDDDEEEIFKEEDPPAGAEDPLS